MRSALLAASALLALAAAAPAFAQPYGAPPPAPTYAAQSQVQVSIGPRFAEKAQRIRIDRQDLEYLQRELYRSATDALAKAGGGAPVRVDLVIEDAVPNRPTFAQMGRNVSLSLSSRGVGGASVSGQVTFADGRTAPIDFRWYESDFRNEFAASTWYDADRAFDMLAGRLRRGDLSPLHVGGPSRDAGNFGYPWPS